MPRVVESLPALRESIGRLRERGDRIGFVPTMGNLHRGHLGLVEEAAVCCEATIASIFVNPTQFGPGEDFEAYPRTFDADLEALESVGCDLVWAPPVEVMYPLEKPFMVQVPEALSDCLCGRSRPGHFDGVATVVLRLLNQVTPDVAVFGEKDYQQLLILRQMARDFALPVELLGAPIVREEDGLAMSSRNGYLDEKQRAVAPTLYRMLTNTAERLAAGEAFEPLKARALEELQAAGFRPDYLEWRSAEDLGEPKPDEPSRVFGAAWLGKARLIDNVPS
ncbi:pantoate--beta-alanine ligase [Wenzhouxiangella sp. EGI_FJ10305]|uniref:pantoate--beta-alanine ligase n=1 Tax=Wenzhouxiangella sp. EGI_FJ10305 TaxID=3243768 RepID=UPI0035D9AFBB